MEIFDDTLSEIDRATEQKVITNIEDLKNTINNLTQLIPTLWLHILFNYTETIQQDMPYAEL